MLLCGSPSRGVSSVRSAAAYTASAVSNAPDRSSSEAAMVRVGPCLGSASRAPATRCRARCRAAGPPALSSRRAHACRSWADGPAWVLPCCHTCLARSQLPAIHSTFPSACMHDGG
eukprot:351491-Chlamydomonas_euryale.AAC.14